MLWGLVTIAIVGFIWLQVSTRSEPRADDPAFRADFELTDHQGKTSRISLLDIDQVRFNVDMKPERVAEQLLINNDIGNGQRNAEAN